MLNEIYVKHEDMRVKQMQAENPYKLGRHYIK
jgi:hypothetical protein